MTPPRTCARCRARPVAHKRVDYCFDCAPDGPQAPPPCRRCGSSDNYWSAGLCARCHQYAPQPIESCRDCHAFGVTRTDKWLCKPCIAWRNNNTELGRCGSCSCERNVGRGGWCRLCWRQASDERAARRGDRKPIDVVAANRHGQQLFFANCGRRQPARPAPRGLADATPRRHWRPRVRQLGLFDAPPNTWAHRHGLAEPGRTLRGQQLEQLVRDHGTRHGWSRNTIGRTRLAVRVLARQQPGQFWTTTVMGLAAHGIPVRPVLDVLRANDLLVDDTTAAIELWFERQLHDLPATMADELRVWFDVLHNGATAAPRRRPRSRSTITTRTNWAMPVLRQWAADGHTSLREITREDVLDILPPAGTPRATTGAALRSIFRTLRERKVVFVNPIARIRTGSFERRQPEPVDVDTLRAVLQSPNPACAALGALVIFHGLRPIELRQLQLIDVRDHRLHVADRTIPLAADVTAGVSRWLDYRSARWPNSINPHLFIHRRTAGNLEPVGHLWVTRTLGIAPSALRADRILDEAIATGGDVRRLSDLFGMTVKSAERYRPVSDPQSLMQT